VKGKARPGRRSPVEDSLRQIEAAFSETPAAPSLEACARMIEAMLFASDEPLTAQILQQRLPGGADIGAALALLRETYQSRGVELVEAAGGWRMQTAPDLEHLFSQTRVQPRKLPRPALETLSVIAYHQPVTRAEIEDVRGVALSKGTLDLLLEIGWVRPRGRRRSPGRPVTYGTTDAFLAHFGLTSLDALPGKDDLKALGAIDARAARELDVPRPGDALSADEDGLQEGDDDAAFYVDHMADRPE
jgi:segregation and condensation protein B